MPQYLHHMAKHWIENQGLDTPIPATIRSIADLRIGMMARIVNPEYTNEYPHPVEIVGLQRVPGRLENVTIVDSDSKCILDGFKATDFVEIFPSVSQPLQPTEKPAQTTIEIDGKEFQLDPNFFKDLKDPDTESPYLLTSPSKRQFCLIRTAQDRTLLFAASYPNFLESKRTFWIREAADGTLSQVH